MRGDVTNKQTSLQKHLMSLKQEATYVQLDREAAHEQFLKLKSDL